MQIIEQYDALDGWDVVVETPRGRRIYHFAEGWQDDVQARVWALLEAEPDAPEPAPDEATALRAELDEALEGLAAIALELDQAIDKLLSRTAERDAARAALDAATTTYAKDLVAKDSELKAAQDERDTLALEVDKVAAELEDLKRGGG